MNVKVCLKTKLKIGFSKITLLVSSWYEILSSISSSEPIPLRFLLNLRSTLGVLGVVPLKINYSIQSFKLMHQIENYAVKSSSYLSSSSKTLN